MRIEFGEIQTSLPGPPPGTGCNFQVGSGAGSAADATDRGPWCPQQKHQALLLASIALML